MTIIPEAYGKFRINPWFHCQGRPRYRSFVSLTAKLEYS